MEIFPLHQGVIYHPHPPFIKAKLSQDQCEKVTFQTRPNSTIDNESKKEDLQDETVSFSASSQLKNATVRIVHAGGRIEMYQNPIPASKLIQRYPGMCVARPHVFKRPYDSLLSGDDLLLPGNKYFIIRSSTVEKLKRRYSQKRSDDEPNYHDRDGSILDSTESEDDHSVETVSSAKDFYSFNDRRPDRIVQKPAIKEKKKFVPPIQRPRIWKEPEWEPSLNSIQELSS